MEENLLRLHDLNKLVAEARKRVEYLKKNRTAFYFRKRRVDVQTWMLNSLVDDACRNLKEIRKLRNNWGTLCQSLLCTVGSWPCLSQMAFTKTLCEKELIEKTL